MKDCGKEVLVYLFDDGTSDTIDKKELFFLEDLYNQPPTTIRVTEGRHQICLADNALW